MEIPSTGPVRLRTNLADYPATLAMKDGRVTSPVAELDFCGPAAAHDGFKTMIQQDAFDAGELAIVTCLQVKAYGKPYAILPFPVSGRFQHQCAGYNSDFGHLDPKDIEGRRVGVRTYTQTTAFWVRGILQHDYGVDLDKVTWTTLADGHLPEYQDPPNCERLPKGSDIPRMMMDGELAAALLVADMPKDPRVRTLIPNAVEAAKAWYAREGMIPINHLFVVRDEVLKARPDVVRELFRMLSESRAAAPEAAIAALPPIGLEANRRQFEMAVDWAVEQKIIPRRLSLDELFGETMAALEA